MASAPAPARSYAFFLLGLLVAVLGIGFFTFLKEAPLVAPPSPAETVSLPPANQPAPAAAGNYKGAGKRTTGEGSAEGADEPRLAEADGEELDEEAADARQAGQEVGRGPAAPSAKRACVVYDRPPRTGSTTISNKMRMCLTGKGFEQPKAPMSKYVRDLMVQRMLELDGPLVGMLSKHMYLSMGDVAAIRAKCAKFLYISSCRPVRERLWSTAKDIWASKGGNKSVIEGGQREHAIERYLTNKRDERFLEHYPYLYMNGTPLGVPVEKRIVPDYVIRNGRMQHDLGELMRAFGCSSKMESRNMHEVEGEEDFSFIDKRKLQYGDETFKRLDRIAGEANEMGLAKVAREFLNP